MPELPEVETVRRVLTARILGAEFLSVDVLSPNQLDASSRDISSRLSGRRIVSLSRRGKFLIFDLDDSSHMVIHLRMEGKLFVMSESEPIDRHDRILFHLDGDRVLAFNDTRRFGRVWLYGPGENLSCLDGLGPEATDIDPAYLSDVLSRERRPLKEVLTDQSIVAGIGNIYADEICFRAGISPFIPACRIEGREKAARDISAASSEILARSIELSGSTVKTYRASREVSGGFQDSLCVYSREGKPCVRCGTAVKKRELGGRGTSFCPRCQRVPEVLGVTGGIASGKTTLCRMLERREFLYIDTDSLSKSLYDEPEVREALSRIDPRPFRGGKLDKSYLRKRLGEDRAFRSRWLRTLYSHLRDRVVRILDRSDGPVAIEAALLFQARLDPLCFHIVQMRTSDTRRRLLERGYRSVEDTARLASTNAWQEYSDRCDILIDTDRITPDEAADIVLDRIRG